MRSHHAYPHGGDGRLLGERRDLRHRCVDPDHESSPAGEREHDCRHLQSQTVPLAWECRQGYHRSPRAVVQRRAHSAKKVTEARAGEMLVTHIQLATRPRVADPPEEWHGAALEEPDWTESRPFHVECSL
jgi:hypothetical protein